MFGGAGDGTIDNPWYWAEKGSGGSATVNNAEATTTAEERKQVFLRVKLSGGVEGGYTIHESFSGGDAYLFLYDENKTPISSDDDGGGRV